MNEMKNVTTALKAANALRERNFYISVGEQVSARALFDEYKNAREKLIAIGGEEWALNMIDDALNFLGRAAQVK